MHMLLTRSAISRGMQLVAGMLSSKESQDAAQDPRKGQRKFQLVSWQPGAHSRREDELARRREPALD